MTLSVSNSNAVENSYSVENNTSNVTINLNISWDGGSHAGDSPRYYFKVNGSQVSSGSKNFNYPAQDWSGGVAPFVSYNIPAYAHNSDGSGSLTWEVGYEGIHSGEGIYTTKSGTLNLTTIPRASEIVSVANFNVEDTFSVTTDKKALSFTDTLSIAVGGQTVKTISNYTSGDDITFTDEEQLAIYNLINDWDDTFTFTLSTYNGGTLIGSDTATATGTIKGDVTYHTNNADKGATFYVGTANGVRRCITYDGTKRTYR